MMLTKTVPLAAALTVCAFGSAAQDTVTVTTLYDESDVNLASALPGDLPGPDGRVSFREALAATNNQPGPNTIEFAIPQSEWWLYDDVAMLELIDGTFLVTDEYTTLDFSSQTRFTGDTNPDGREVGIYGLQPNGWGHAAIVLYASNTTVIGLGPVNARGSSITIEDGSNNNRIIGCDTLGVEIDPYPGTSSGNIIGGTEPGEGNVIFEIEIHCGANDNLVIGNTINHVDVVGSRYCLPENQYPLNNRIGGSAPEERNVINGFGTRSSEGFPSGEGVEVLWAKDTIVEGNYIGVTADGMSRVSQLGTAGVKVADSFDTIVRGNLIAGIRSVGSNHAQGQVFGNAINVAAINADNHRTLIQGNIIGMNASGTGPITTRQGIHVAPYTGRFTTYDTVIGGTGPGEANIIAYTELDGVNISPTVTDVLITGNSIHGNQGIGIDLIPFGTIPSIVTPNDPGDADTGGNNLQNFPVISDVTAAGSTMTVDGSLSSRPSTQYRIEFFASSACDDSGFGQGEHYLGMAEVTTDASGEAEFSVELPMAPAGMEVITSTATDINASATSEFSACFAMTLNTCLADVNGDGALTPADFSAWIDAYNTKNPVCDQNNDNECSPADFSAWVANFNAGC